MTFCVDIDDTLLYSYFDKKEYNIIDKNKKLISLLNRLYNEGATVVLHTGRHWDKLEATIDHLQDAGILYTTLVMGKPTADYYIDDKAILPENFIELMEPLN